MNDTVRLLEGRMPQDQWNPRFHISPKLNDLYIRFSPPFPKAAYHEICVADYHQICFGGICKVNKTGDECVFLDVPSNQSYAILVRPYNSAGDWLDSWVQKNYFYPPASSAETTTRYVSSNATVSASPKHLQNTSYIIIVVVVVLVLLLVVFLLLVTRNRNPRYLTSLSFRNMCSNFFGNHGSSQLPIVVTVIPVFIQNVPAFKHMVDEHLILLEKHKDLQIQKSPFTSEAEYNEAIQNVDSWVNSQIDLFVQNKDTHIIIYVSDELLCLLQNPQAAERHEQICLRMINRLSDRLKKKGVKKPFVLCFGCENDYPVCSPLNEFRHIASAVKLGPNGNVSFTGTVELINEFFQNPLDCSICLTTEETKELQIQFTQHINLNYEFDEEEYPAITAEADRLINSNINGTSGCVTQGCFETPDSSSVYASEHSVQLALHNFNERAGW